MRGLFNLTVVVAALAIVWGWFLNLITIFTSDMVLTGEFILRIVGIFVFPLGGILGYF